MSRAERIKRDWRVLVDVCGYTEDEMVLHAAEEVANLESLLASEREQRGERERVVEKVCHEIELIGEHGPSPECCEDWAARLARPESKPEKGVDESSDRWPIVKPEKERGDA
jgi:hypothetical protein